MGTKRRLLAAAALALVSAVVTAASARADLLDPETLALSGQGANSPQVAITPSGWALATWVVSKQEGAHVIAQVRGAWRPPGGGFGIPFVVARGGSQALAATSDDKVAVGWQDDSGAYAELLTPGVSHGHPLKVRPWSNGMMGPVVAADEHGRAVFVVADADGLFAATRERGGDVAAPVRIAAMSAQYPVVASNGDGDVAIVAGGYKDMKSLGNLLVTRRPGGAFSDPIPVPIDEATGPSVAVANDGTVAVAASGNGLEVVTGADGFNHIVPHQSTGVTLATKASGRPFATQKLDTAGEPIATSATPDGGLTVIGRQGGAVWVRDRHADGTLSDPVPFPTDDVCFSAPVIAPVGTVLVIGTACDAFTGTMALTDRPAGGVFAPPVAISEPNSGMPVVAANDDGAVVVAWTHWPEVGSMRHGTIQAVVREGSSEVSLLAPSGVLDVSKTGLVDLPLSCSGFADCVGTLAVVPAGGRSARAASGRARPVARRSVRIGRGTSRRLRLRLPASARHSGRMRLEVRLDRAQGAAANRTIPITLRVRR